MISLLFVCAISISVILYLRERRTLLTWEDESRKTPKPVMFTAEQIEDILTTPPSQKEHPHVS